MERIRFGKSGLLVSRIAFGGIPIMRLSKNDAVRVVRECLDMGVNFIDTANAYLDSEEKIGAAIAGRKREELVIASKSGADDKKTFTAHLDNCLKMLGTDYVDIYQHHNISSREKQEAVFGPNGAFEGMMEAVKAGKVRFPGFSSHNVPTALNIMKTEHFFSVQLPYNFIDTEAEREAIPLARKLDMGFIAMKPLGGGLLDNAQLAFRFLGACEGIIPDPGIEKSAEMREIIAVITENNPLTPEDFARIEAFRAELGASWCHRCDYCQPCPQDIGISLVLGLKSSIKRMPVARAVSMTSESITRARTCIECHACESRCPYHLRIPELLKESVAWWDANVRV
ncbi:MAG: aldo/keto reductase [Spirochaetaceae bacterium]|jgi:predicted aldo/keto reductase-like oxidoreductase|nr:aldo/keto reductase [Spirochaetaceae bacterium]